MGIIELKAVQALACLALAMHHLCVCVCVCVVGGCVCGGVGVGGVVGVFFWVGVWGGVC